MDVTGVQRRELGATGLSVSSICFGTSPLSMAQLYGHEVPERQAVETVLAVLDSEVNFLDTSNDYGDGESERRIGEAVRQRGGLPEGFVLASKVDPDPRTGDFSGSRVRASVEESLERLHLERFPLLHFHDPERTDFAASMAQTGAVPALLALKEQGLVERIGVAGGPVELMSRYAQTGLFDVVLTHNRFTLLDRSAGPLIAMAAERGMGVLNAAPYGGGMLAKGPRLRSQYAYGLGDALAADRASRMSELCAAAGVPLAAAALQFSMREPRIHSTVVGVSEPRRIAQTLEFAAVAVPQGLWAELEELALPEERWIG